MTKNVTSTPKPSFDPACLTLARYFLVDEPNIPMAMAEPLAADIQRFIEDWLNLHEGKEKEPLC